MKDGRKALTVAGIIAGVGGIGYLIYRYTRGEEPPPGGCIDGEMACVGYDRFVCVDNQWVLYEKNAEACGYIPPPNGPECAEGSYKCIGYDGYICSGGKWILYEHNSPDCGYTPPPPVCNEGDAKCEGYDLYICRGGEWVLDEINSEACGYVPPPPPPSTYEVHFTVLDRYNQMPVVGALLTADGVSGVTDTSGMVTMDVNGTARVVITASGYRTGTSYLSISYEPVYVTILLTPEEVPPPTGKSITFEVLDDSTGQLVKGALVSSEGYAKYTDTFGKATLKLEVGDHSVIISKPGYETWSGMITVTKSETLRVYLLPSGVPPPPEEPTVSISVSPTVISPNGSVSIRFTFTGGKPNFKYIGQSLVSCKYGISGPRFVTVYSDANGSFEHGPYMFPADYPEGSLDEGTRYPCEYNVRGIVLDTSNPLYPRQVAMADARFMVE